MEGALDLIYPPQCAACGTPVDGGGGLCGPCWREAAFASGPSCSCCGTPLPDDGSAAAAGGATLRCDGCTGVDWPWQRGVAAMAYTGTGRQLVLALKHGDRPDLARRLGGWLAEAAAPLVQPGMIVVPVPLHPARLMRRKYNQAALIAAQVARRLHLPHRPAALIRQRNTPMQDHRSVADRFANQAEAFALRPSAQAGLAGQPVLLVDDVMASGATLAAAAAALAAAGSGSVSIAVLARALRGG